MLPKTEEMASEGNGAAVRDYSTEIEAVHKRQNLLEDREIRNAARITRVEDTQRDHRDWIVKALGPVHEQLHEIQKFNNEKFNSLQKAVRKLFAKLDEHGMGRSPDRKKQAKRKSRRK